MLTPCYKTFIKNDCELASQKTSNVAKLPLHKDKMYE